jgi:hypothetical protein
MSPAATASAAVSSVAAASVDSVDSASLPHAANEMLATSASATNLTFFIGDSPYLFGGFIWYLFIYH